MDQPIFLRILKIILVMTCVYKKYCNAFKLIYKGYSVLSFWEDIVKVSLVYIFFTEKYYFNFKAIR